jgi:disulfide bond formation protein DsbB
MKTSKLVLIAVALVALGLVGFALYLQHIKQMQPCPLCIIQRYAFIGVALICIVAAFLPATAARIGAGLGTLAALAGAGVAGHHVWILAHPGTSCGIDPLETALNKYPTAELMPYLFKADGLCSDALDPVLGLQIPHWSLLWFAVLAVILLWVAFKRRA